MKHKSIFSRVLAVAACAVLAAVWCTGCGSSGKGGESEPTPPAEHEHTYADGWTYNDEYHWHASTCGHADAVKDKAKHVMDGVECTVCDFVHEHTYADGWTYNDEYHWRASTCGHDDAVKDKTAHVMDGLRCTECDFTLEPSPLDYEALTGDGDAVTGYRVAGWADSATEKSALVIPDEYMGAPVTEIASNAFENDPDIKTIRFPKAMKTIGFGAFSGCTALTNVTLEGAETLGGQAFSGCTSLERAELRNVKTVGSLVFYLCENLEYARVDGATSLGDQAFRGCTVLSEVVLGDGLTTIGTSTFYQCGALKKLTLGKDFSADADTQFSAYPSNLESIAVAAENETYASENGVLYNKAMTETILVPLGYKGRLVLHDGVTSIVGTKLGVAYHEYVTALVIPASVTDVGTSSTFGGCYRLVEIVNLCDAEIKAGALGLESDVRVIDSPSDAKTSDEDEEGYVWYEDETPLLVAYFGDETDLTLPSSHNGKDYSVRQYAFYSVPLNSVTTTGGAKEFGNYAFGFPFSPKSPLTAAHFGDGLEKLGQHVFDHCPSLSDVVLPKTVVEIESGAFGSGCDALTSLKYMGGLQDWAKVSYWDTTANRKAILLNGSEPFPEKIVIENVTVVGRGAFYGAAITTVVIGKGVETLDSNAFGGSATLSSVVLGPDVKVFSNAFSSGFTGAKTNVSKIYYEGDSAAFAALNYGRGNDASGAKNAAVYYYEAEDPLEKPGNFWHWNGDEIEEW